MRSKEEVEYDIITQTKVCTKCRIRLSFNQFYKCKKYKDGKRHVCIDCSAAKDPYRRHPTEVQKDINIQSKVCKGCNLRKDFSMFYKRKDTIDKRMSRCKSCLSTNKNIKRSEEDILGDIKLSSKVCTVCKVRRTFNDFYNRKTSKDGKGNRCKYCDDIARKESKSRNPKEAWRSMRNSNLKRKFGISIDQYDNMLKSQNECCAICDLHVSDNIISGKFHSLSVDHCHDTGDIRGLLCNQCNRGIGMLGDRPESLMKAFNYLNNHYSK